MSYLAGKIVLAVEAGAPNNGKGDGTTGRVKSARVRGRTYPYVSAQAYRRWLRDTMTAQGVLPSPTERVGKAQGKAQKATTAADPALYADDDLFGYMKTSPKSGEDGATTLRETVVMVGTFLSVEPVRLTEDYGVMSRGIPEPVLHSHEFYTADLAAPLLVDVPRIGTFTLPTSKGGKANYLDQKTALDAAAAMRAGADVVDFRDQTAVRLPIEVRRERLGALLEGWAELTGGAKKALHYGDRTPVLFMLVPMAGGVNPLGFVVDGADDGSGLRVRGEVLRQELAAWAGEWEAPVLVGWRPGFRDDLRKQFEVDLGAELDAGHVVIDHPRTILRGLAAQARAGAHDGWFDDPAKAGNAPRPAG